MATALGPAPGNALLRQSFRRGVTIRTKIIFLMNASGS
jgi:hypothetical protein